jgi:hypothetical protein
MVAGGNDTEQAQDGDFTDHDARDRQMQDILPVFRPRE